MIMGMLQKMLDEQMDRCLDLKEVAKALVLRKLLRCGADVEDNKITIRQDESNRNVLRIDIDIPEDLWAEIRADFGEVAEGSLLQFTDEECSEYFDEIKGKFTRGNIQKFVETAGVTIVDGLNSSNARVLEEHYATEEEFETRLRTKWGSALDLLRSVIILSIDIGNDLHRDLNGKPYGCRTDAIMRLSARACLIADEVHALLRTGHPYGAMARWRALHEVAVISYFLAEHEEEVSEKYLWHDRVESYKAALEHQKHATKLGFEAFSSEQLARFKSRRDDALAVYGPEFKNNYGWASDALGKKGPNFSEIEQAVDLDKFRPFYRISSHHVHSHSASVIFKLGLSPSLGGRLLAGPSNAGLTDPGQMTAISLAQTISSLLLLDTPSIDLIVGVNVLSQFVDRTRDAFFEVHIMEKEES